MSAPSPTTVNHSLGFGARLEPEDAIELPYKYQPQYLYYHFNRSWGSQTRPSVSRALWSSVGCLFLQGMFLVLGSVALEMCGKWEFVRPFERARAFLCTYVLWQQL